MGKVLIMPREWAKELADLHHTIRDKRDLFANFLSDIHCDEHIQDENAKFFEGVDMEHLEEELDSVVSSLEYLLKHSKTLLTYSKEVDSDLTRVETQHGDLYIGYGDQYYRYAIFDSDKRLLFRFETERERTNAIEQIKRADSLSNYLEKFDDVCWGSKDQIIKWTKNYHESNDREVDLEWLEDNYNRIGSTFILFEYSEAYL